MARLPHVHLILGNKPDDENGLGLVYKRNPIHRPPIQGSSSTSDNDDYHHSNNYR